MAWSLPCSSGFIHAISSPTVDLPTFLAKFLWRNEHCKVGLSACGRKRSTDIILAAVGRFDADDEHMFRKPSVITPKRRGNAESEALFTEQSIAAISRTIACDGILFGKMNDVFVFRVRRTRPCHVLDAFGQWRSDRAEAAWEFTVTESFRAFVPMRVISFILTAT